MTAGDYDDDAGAIDSAVARKAVAAATATPARLAAQSYALLDGMSEGIDAALLDIDAMMAAEEEEEEEEDEEKEEDEEEEEE